MKENTIESTNRLLKVMIALLLRSKVNDESTLREQIAILNNLGLRPSEIAEILGRSGIYVSKELSLIKKAK